MNFWFMNAILSRFCLRSSSTVSRLAMCSTRLTRFPVVLLLLSSLANGLGASPSGSLFVLFSGAARNSLGLTRNSSAVASSQSWDTLLRLALVTVVRPRTSDQLLLPLDVSRRENSAALHLLVRSRRSWGFVLPCIGMPVILVVCTVWFCLVQHILVCHHK